MSPTTGSSPSAAARARFASVEGAARLFSPAFLDYLVGLHDRLTPRVHALRQQRTEALPVSEGYTHLFRQM